MLTGILIATALATPKPYKHPVVIWIPPYAVGACETQLQKPYVADAITHLSLQFWIPDGKGGITLSKLSPDVSPTTIRRLRDWGHQHGVRVMLCVYNYSNDWDWPLAKSGFVANPDKFAAALTSEMKRYDLDGVDVDLEGPDANGDLPDYVKFLVKASISVHQSGKQIMAASFCSVWNAPNTVWWPHIFAHLDGLTSMGYDSAGVHAKAGLTYEDQIKAAGVFANRLQLGVPSYKDPWAGDSALAQLLWIAKDNKSGLGIWDAQLRTDSWQSAGLWKVIKTIRDGSYK